jgi:nucleoside-triphosphatase THEP1
MRLHLITGRPGIGKTTFVQKFAESIGFETCQGFYTTEIRKRNTRIGFEWRTFDGKNGTLADLEPGEPRVGKYRVVLDSFDEMLKDLQQHPPGKILLIDEVGKMECLSTKFRDLLLHWEKWNVFRIFTVAQRGTLFIENFKARNKNDMIQLTTANRNEIREQLLDEFL